MESTFASRIRQYRQERNLSQQALAELCGLTQGNVAHMENGTEPKQSNVSKLLAGLPDLNPDWLLIGSGPMLRDGRALTPAPPASPLRINTDGESEGYWKALAQERLGQLKSMEAQIDRLWGQNTELLKKPEASAETASLRDTVDEIAREARFAPLVEVPEIARFTPRRKAALRPEPVGFRLSVA